MFPENTSPFAKKYLYPFTYDRYQKNFQIKFVAWSVHNILSYTQNFTQTTSPTSIPQIVRQKHSELWTIFFIIVVEKREFKHLIDSWEAVKYHLTPSITKKSPGDNFFRFKRYFSTFMLIVKNGSFHPKSPNLSLYYCDYRFRNSFRLTIKLHKQIHFKSNQSENIRLQNWDVWKKIATAAKLQEPLLTILRD